MSDITLADLDRIDALREQANVGDHDAMLMFSQGVFFKWPAVSAQLRRALATPRVIVGTPPPMQFEDDPPPGLVFGEATAVALDAFAAGQDAASLEREAGRREGVLCDCGHPAWEHPTETPERRSRGTFCDHGDGFCHCDGFAVTPVDAAREQGALDEREACAAICDALADPRTVAYERARGAAARCAEAIRARGAK